MAKRRNRKVYITDIAISKVPRIEYKGLSKQENDLLYSFAVLVLKTAKDENDSNEVAVTCLLDKEESDNAFGISFGDEHGVDVCADTLSNHLIVSCSECAVIVLHNHPSTQTLSLEDISFFIHYDTVKIIIVVTNQGNVHYLCKEKHYSPYEAITLYNECIMELTIESSWKDIYFAGLNFLSRCSEVGMYYS